MQVIVTIIPIFIIIILGWGARKKGFITPDFLEPANRLVYYLSIPALIFSSIAKASFHEQFDSTVLIITLVAATSIYVTGDILVRLLKMPPSRAGVFVQGGGHGNVGYLGLPIAFYYLGESGIVKASIICGFLMILQNLLSVVALQLHGGKDKRFPGVKAIFSRLLRNPVIIGAMSGIAVSALEINVPNVIERSLNILGGLAPPMALLLIGASISPHQMRRYILPTIGSMTLKLAVLPALALLLFSIFHVSPKEYLPALILLSSPTATIAYVMAREMDGDCDFAVSVISASTLFSAVTYVFWLAIAEHMAAEYSM